VIQYNYDCVNSKPLILKHRGAETKFRKVKEKGHDLYEIEVVEYIKEALIESLKDEITDGDFCGLLASKLDDGKKADQSKAGVKAVSDQVNGIGNYPFVG
jgi:hypothetical protein